MSPKIKTNNNSGLKELLLVTCHRCKNQVEHRSTLLCTICKNHYEFDCAGYPEKVYRLKNSEERKKFRWECKTCTNKVKQQKTPRFVISNVTKRKKRSSPKSSIATISNAPEETTPWATPKSTTSSICDSHILTIDHTSDEGAFTDKTLSRSMDYTEIDYINAQEFKDTIELLQTQLSSSQNELENIILENNELRTRNDKLLKDNATLKGFLSLPPQRENNSVDSEITRNVHTYSFLHSDMLAYSTPPRYAAISKTNTKTQLYCNISNLQKDIADLEDQLKQAGDEIINLKDQIQNLERIVKAKERLENPKREENYCNAENKVVMLNKKTQTSHQTCDNTLTQNKKRTLISHLSDVAIGKTSGVLPKQKNKLAIISSGCTKGTLPLIDEIFSDNFEYCHYLLPNVITEDVLTSIEHKLKAFSINDYCLIFIGENDLKNDDYIGILDNLRKYLKKNTHTNVVVGAPTFICGALIYNYKVELFNNLLYWDIKNNRYAYSYDTNRTLSLEMFSINTGKINKHGWKNIFEQIRSNIIYDYEVFSSQDTVTLTDPNEVSATQQTCDFFRK